MRSVCGTRAEAESRDSRSEAEAEAGQRRRQRQRQRHARHSRQSGSQSGRQTNLEGYGQILHIHLAIQIAGCIVVVAGGHVATSCTNSAAIKMEMVCSATFAI